MNATSVREIIVIPVGYRNLSQHYKVLAKLQYFNGQITNYCFYKNMNCKLIKIVKCYMGLLSSFVSIDKNSNIAF